MLDEALDVRTRTTEEQDATERDVRQLFSAHVGQLQMWRGQHVAYALEGVRGLNEGYQGLDASRPWLCYWTIHTLDILGALTDEPTDKDEPRARSWFGTDDIPDKLESFLLGHCQHPRGGFQGGPGQLAHVAPTYAATNAIMALGSRRCYDAVNRQGIYDFLMSMKTISGAFRMQHDGETDVRATYCAIAIAAAFNLLTPELTDGVAAYIKLCQTFEGGLGGEPGNEAHGGYTFCGLAAVVLLDATHVLDLPALLHWAVHRQMTEEGGFQGRCNKLVDSCYSFWVGALFPLLHSVISKSSEPAASFLPQDSYLFLHTALQRYLVVAAQEVRGGFKDKPGKGRDFYHTCYSLSGLSIAMHTPATANLIDSEYKLKPVDPRFGVSVGKTERMLAYFRNQPQITSISSDVTYDHFSQAHVTTPPIELEEAE